MAKKKNLNENEVIEIGPEKVPIDCEKMGFDEASLSKYIQEEASWFSYLGQKMADLDWMRQRAEAEYEHAFAAKFVELKEGGGGSDKLVDMKCKSDEELYEKKKKIAGAKRLAEKMRQHMRAWDKNHDNASNYGHNLRKEMEKLAQDIKWSKDAEIADKVEAIIRGGEAGPKKT